MNRNDIKKLTFEDRFARKYYCNSHRFIKKIKRINNKKLRTMNKKMCNY